MRDREDTRDANPLIKALPAQVGRRRDPQPSQAEKEGDVVTLDRQLVFGMKPEHRAKWLSNALTHVQAEQSAKGHIYCIISSNRFVDGVQPKLGKRMATAVIKQLELFSAKQKRFLTSESALVQKFGASELPQPNDTAEDDPNDMMARCEAFAREKLAERGEAGGQAGDKGAAPEPAEPPVDAEGIGEKSKGKIKDKGKEKVKDRENKEDKVREKDMAKDRDKNKEKDRDKDKEKVRESKSKKNRKADTESDSSSSDVRKKRKRGRSRSRKKSASSSSSSGAARKKKKAEKQKKRKQTSSSSSCSSASGRKRRRRRNASKSSDRSDAGKRRRKR